MKLDFRPAIPKPQHKPVILWVGITMKNDSLLDPKSENSKEEEILEGHERKDCVGAAL